MQGLEVAIDSHATSVLIVLLCYRERWIDGLILILACSLFQKPSGSHAVRVKQGSNCSVANLLGPT